MQKRYIRMNAQQRHAWRLLLTRFAEEGYAIVPLSKRFRSSPFDMVAVPPPGSCLAFIQPRGDKILVRPNVRLFGLETKIDAYSDPALQSIVKWIDRALIFRRGLQWYEYFTPKGREELTLLGRLPIV